MVPGSEMCAFLPSLNPLFCLGLFQKSLARSQAGSEGRRSSPSEAPWVISRLFGELDADGAAEIALFGSLFLVTGHIRFALGLPMTAQATLAIE